ncbi:unnamed protein product [Brassica rapa subsp. narinosa]
MKNQANEAFKGHKFSHAIDMYTKSIELSGNNVVYWFHLSGWSLHNDN